MDDKDQPPSFSISTDLPGYSADQRPAPHAREQSEHVYTLDNNKGRVWVTLKVKSDAPSAKVLPLFLQGAIISGTVEVDVEKPESAKAVTIGVLAENTAVGQEPQKFLELTTTLWSGSKLSGKQSWPYSITLPKDTSIPIAESPKGKASTHPLPPSFTERASPAYIVYKLTVTVKRGAFKVNNLLSTSFAYVPVTRAEPPSELRKLAYSDGSALIGPDGDPEGWKALPPVEITGTLFDAKPINLECILALATPNSYAMGSPIPLFLTIKCNDDQALDLLSTPSAIPVFLTRIVAVGSEATIDNAPRRSNNTFQERVGKAFFWPSDEGAIEKGVRRLCGEIEVRKGTKPSFIFPRFSLRYFVGLFPLEAAGFVPGSPADQALLSERVHVVTENAPGVVSRSHAPPGYAQEDLANYNNSMGFLENGNQRFYHHGH